MILFILFFLFLNFASADEFNRGLEIALKADNSFSGYGDSKTNLKMLLKNRKGSITERVMKMNLLEVPEDGDKSLIVFENYVSFLLMLTAVLACRVGFMFHS